MQWARIERARFCARREEVVGIFRAFMGLIGVFSENGNVNKQ